VPKLPNAARPLPERLDDIEATLAGLSEELRGLLERVVGFDGEIRTRRLVVLDGEDYPLIELHTVGRHGVVDVGGAGGSIRIDAAPGTSAAIDVTAGGAEHDTAAHLHADAECETAGFALSSAGNVWADRHIRRSDTGESWVIALGTDRH
jgi:hypothetical protein